MDETTKREFLEAVHNRQPVAGLTHSFYRYPARFSPLFARAAIEAFSEPGDVILDPFMGGGTTLVEARALGRHAVGTDINALAVFVSKVKTTLFSEADLTAVSGWVKDIARTLNLHESANDMSSWLELGYLRNIEGKTTWPIRKMLSLSLDRANELPQKQQNLARCILLKTSQWALDCRSEIPNTQLFRRQLLKYSEEITAGARDFARSVRKAVRYYQLDSLSRTSCLHRSAIGLEVETEIRNSPTPRLILTSPPYPGVHVLYHRWQIQGRRETATPFWITNTLDGNGASFYTFGDRKQAELTDYYEQALAAFTSLAHIADDQTLVVQMVAFSDPSWQLPKYLAVMKEAGFREALFSDISNSSDERIWREVPNRKWYANQRRVSATSKEVVLFHRLR